LRCEAPKPQRTPAGLIEGSCRMRRNGVAIADEVALVLSEITTASGKVNMLVAEIAAASSEQSQGVSRLIRHPADGQVTQTMQQRPKNAPRRRKSSAARASSFARSVVTSVTLCRARVKSPPIPGHRDRRAPAQPPAEHESGHTSSKRNCHLSTRAYSLQRERRLYGFQCSRNDVRRTTPRRPRETRARRLSEQ